MKKLSFTKANNEKSGLGFNDGYKLSISVPIIIFLINT